MTKLQQLNVSPFILRWICSYLTARQQKVVSGGEESETIPVISGVPQGSVLGPLLFLIYINDVARVSLSEGSTLVLYADDMLLYRKIDSTEDFIALQRDINTINNWTKENHLTFNIAKCKYMLISRKRQAQPMPDLFLDDVSLERVQYFKYLGILLAADLSWTHHIEAVCTKARKLLGLLYRRFYEHADLTAPNENIWIVLHITHLKLCKIVNHSWQCPHILCMCSQGR